MSLMPDQKKSASKPGHQVPEKKKTTLGHYVTSEEAYAMWKNEPGMVHILDVRTPEEYVFVGHAEMARNIPLLFVKHEWNPETSQFVVEPNPDFITEAKRQFKLKDTLLVMCRSGDRSAMAVNALAKAGFVNVYNIFDGMEGDLVDDPRSKQHGKRVKNGWKNCGAPWTYEVNPDQTCLPGVRK
jgi:rhodanese-related sulfurtransferase